MMEMHEQHQRHLAEKRIDGFVVFIFVILLQLVEKLVESGGALKNPRCEVSAMLISRLIP